MANERKVEILMSTYNGEKFLKEQLDSILHQTYRDISILVRDDGSKDSTLKILSCYQKNTNLEVIYGQNVGSANSFFELLRKSNDSAMYYAFSDQDDVWIENKIENGIKMIENLDCHENIPILYCSNLMLVDENLNLINSKVFNKTVNPSFNNSLVQNIAVGCTIILNRKARDILKKKLPFNKVQDHDWWAYTAISAFGSVIYDDKSYIYYRQHSNNTIGAPTSKLEKLRRRIMKFLKKDNIISNYVKVFNDFYGVQLNSSQKKLVKLIVSYKTNIKIKLKLITSLEIYRQSKLDTILLKFLSMINKF